MPGRAKSMRCPDCRVEMNHHARKLREPISPGDAARIDEELGAIVTEVHTCPQCGTTHARDAD